MRRVPILFLVTALLAGLGCQTLTGAGDTSGASAAPERGLARIVSSGELRVGMTGEQAPLNVVAKNGEWLGLEVALANVLGENLGVKPVFVRTPFAELLPALEAGTIDVVMSGMTITARRNLRAAFVGPYYVSGKSIVTRQATLLEVHSAAELNQPGFRFAALEGSTSEEFVRKLLPKATLVTTKGLDEAVQLVISGQADALLADQETCALAVLRNPDAGLAALTTPLTIEPIGIALPPDDPQLVNLMENYIDALESTGALERATDVWFEDPAWLQALD